MLLNRYLLAATLLLSAGCTGTTDEGPETASAEVRNLELITLESSFIYEAASFPSAHASTIVETPAGMAAAWFGGTAEKDPDVSIWFSLHDGTTWSTPVEVADGVDADGTDYACWNPVLFQPEDGPLVLFYKVGPSPREWWGVVRTSEDNGQTWSEETRLPEGILGPIRAKPVLMEDGSLLAGSSTEHAGWVVHMERLKKPQDDQVMWNLAYLASPEAWEVIGPLNDPEEYDAIQPTILVHTPTEIQIMCRSTQDAITQSWSSDGGSTWEAMTASELPNPSAGIDAVRLKDGSFLLIYNPTTSGRHQLAVAHSEDGESWEQLLLVEDQAGEYSYPAMVQHSDGSIHLTYTWRRERIKHVILEITSIS